MKWFRIWVDILDDHKIAQLSDYEFRLFIFLLACASEEDAINGALTRQLPDINRRCRRRKDWFNRALETFQKLQLITVSADGYITICNWNKRQFATDRSYDRVKKYRAQLPVRNVSVTVNETPPDTDTDTDIKKRKKKKEKYTFDFLAFWEAYPKRTGSKFNAFTQWLKLNGQRPELAILLSSISAQLEWRAHANGDFRPEWKDAERWLKGKCWESKMPEQCSNDDYQEWTMRP